MIQDDLHQDELDQNKFTIVIDVLNLLVRQMDNIMSMEDFNQLKSMPQFDKNYIVVDVDSDNNLI